MVPTSAPNTTKYCQIVCQITANKIIAQMVPNIENSIPNNAEYCQIMWQILQNTAPTIVQYWYILVDTTQNAAKQCHSAK